MKIKKFEQITLPTPYPVGPIQLYYIKTDSHRILFDSGPPTREAMTLLSEKINLRKLDYLFITHFHPDHYGAAHLIEKESNATIVFSENDLNLYRYYELRSQFFFDYLKQVGVPAKVFQPLKTTFGVYKKSIPLPDKYQILEESDSLLKELGIAYISCPGHSQSDIVYLIDDYAITGDTMLRSIFQTPLLDLDFSNLKYRYKNYVNYVKSIDKLKSLETKKIRPAHNNYIDSVNHQIRFYYKKVMERAILLAPILDNNSSMYHTVLKLFPKIETRPFHFYVKLSETVFMKDYLKNPDILRQSLLKNKIINE